MTLPCRSIRWSTQDLAIVSLQLPLLATGLAIYKTNPFPCKKLKLFAIGCDEPLSAAPPKRGIRRSLRTGIPVLRVIIITCLWIIIDEINTRSPNGSRQRLPDMVTPRMGARRERYNRDKCYGIVCEWLTWVLRSKRNFTCQKADFTCAMLGWRRSG